MEEREIIKALSEKKLVIGYNKSLKMLKLGKLKQVICANNTSSRVKEIINNNSNINGVTVEEYKKNNVELGTLCKKPFPITVVSILKEK